MPPPAIVAVAIALAATASPALAETVHCADAKGEVAVEYDIDESQSLITRVQMQITGDFGISTDPTHPDHSGETIAEQLVTGDGVDVMLRVEGGPPALHLRLVVVSHGHGAHWLNAGALSVEGGGLWAVTCDK
jgi:hypothetical protein